MFAGIDPLNGRCQVSRIGGDGSKRLVIVQRLRLIGGSEEFPVEDAKLVKHHPHGIRRIAAVVPARPNEHRRLVDEDTRFEGVFIELLVLFLKKTVERLGLAWCIPPRQVPPAAAQAWCLVGRKEKGLRKAG